MRTIPSLLVFSFSVLLLGSRGAGATNPSDLLLNLDKAELSIKVVVTHTYHSAYDTQRGRDEQNDQFTVTVEGTYQYKKYEIPGFVDLPDIPGLPSLPSWPKVALLAEDSRTLTISGSGQGNIYDWWMSWDCMQPYFYPCREFKEEGTYDWTYTTINPVYEGEVVTGLGVYQDSEKDPVRYHFQISEPFDEHFSDYIRGSGVQTRTYRGYELNKTDTYTLDEYYGPAADDIPWIAWLGTPEGGEANGVLTFEGDQFTGSGQITYPYEYTDDSSGLVETGTVEISYKLNPKPGPKKIQPNQVLGRYKYVDEDHYVPASDFVAGKDTAIQVFFDKAIPVDRLSGEISLEVYKDGAQVATLTDFIRDAGNNALIFQPKSRSACGNWEAGTYKFKAKVREVDTTLDHVQFRQRRELKVLAVPVKTKFEGVVEVPTNEWQNGYKCMRQTYPVAYDKVTWTRGPLFDATGEDCNTVTAAGERKLWDELNKMGAGYDLVIGFVQSRIPVTRRGSITKIQGYAYRSGKASVVVNSDEDMQATVPHEVAHLFQVGDTYNGGTYHLTINSPPFGYVGRDWDTGSSVTASDREVKDFGGGSGTLIAKELHPFETGGRGLLKHDMLCFMGSGTSQSNYWITPEVWKQLFRSLAPTTGTSTAGSVIMAMADETGPQRYVEASGWVSTSGVVEPSLPWDTVVVPDTVDVTEGTYTIQARDVNDAVLGRQGFTPSFVNWSNPPEDLDAVPFSRLLVPFPEGTVKFVIVDQNGKTRTEVPVSPHAPTVAVTKPPAGQVLSGPYTITWTASDADGDRLFYRVQYSPDGQRWIDLPPSVTTTSLATDFSVLPGGDQARIRVTASDGINSRSATSETFNVPRKETEVTIDSPAADSLQRLDAGIVFQGSAYDPQEGEIFDDQRLVWTSDRDGEIGRGGTLFVSKGLAAGRHVITLTATDSLGQTASRSVALVIPPAPPTLDPDGGTFPGPITVRVTGIATGATAYYTTDGSDPTVSTGAILYSGPFTVSTTCTLKVALYSPALQVWSSVTIRDFVITGQ